MMQTAIKWLLEKLEAEGRHDLVAQYHEKNREYQRAIAEKQRAQRKEQRALDEATIQVVDLEDWYGFVGAKSHSEVLAEGDDHARTDC